MKTASRYLLAYTLWVVSLIVAGMVGIITRDVFSTLINVIAGTASAGDPRAEFYSSLQVRAAEPWSYIVLGLGLIIVFGVLENYYRTGAAERKLLARFLLVTGIEIAVLAAAHGTGMVLNAIRGWDIWTGLALTLIELAVTVIFIWLSRRLAAQHIEV